jgi:hypothetical protein
MQRPSRRRQRGVGAVLPVPVPVDELPVDEVPLDELPLDDEPEVPVLLP